MYLTVGRWRGRRKAECQITLTTMLNSLQKLQPNNSITANSGQDMEGAQKVTC